MINIETKKAYSEMLELFKFLPSEYIERTPKEILDVLKKERLENYIVHINTEKPIDRNVLQEETIQLLAMLNYNYWCTDEYLKNKLYEQYSKNEEQYQKELSQKYDINRVFEKRNKYNNTFDNQVTSLVEYKETFFEKLINKIKNFLKIK